MAGRRQHGLPQQLARELVEGPDFAVEDGSGDEYQTSRGHQRAAVVLAARGVRARFGQFGILSERNPPGVIARSEVDGVERSPGRLDSRIAVGILKPGGFGKRVGADDGRVGRPGLAGQLCVGGRHGFPPRQYVFSHRVQRVGAESAESGHGAGAERHELHHLQQRMVLAQTRQWR